MSKNYKKFTNLEKLVIRKMFSKIDNYEIGSISANSNQLDYKVPQRMVTESKRNLGTLGGLSSSTLVYLATSDKADTELRVNSIFVLFHKLNTEEEYPFMDLITKEEYISEAIIPELKSILTILELKLDSGSENETSESVRKDSPDVVVAQVEEPQEEYRGGGFDANGKRIPKPQIL